MTGPLMVAPAMLTASTVGFVASDPLLTDGVRTFALAVAVVVGLLVLLALSYWHGVNR